MFFSSPPVLLLLVILLIGIYMLQTVVLWPSSTAIVGHEQLGAFSAKPGLCSDLEGTV